MAEVNELAAELYQWEGRENHDVSIRYDPSWFGNPPCWMVSLDHAQDYGDPHHADWVARTWNFYGDTLEEALSLAVEFTRALAALDADDWVNPVTGHGADCGCISCHMSQVQ